MEEENITELVEFKKTTVLAAFSSKEGLDSVVSDTVKLVGSFEHDMSTGASRARTASLAAKVAKLKTRLDGLGKDLVADWKAKAKAVDSSRKRMRDDLDALKIEARKPLTDWEDEQAAITEAKRVDDERIEAERVAKEAADKLYAEIGQAEELAAFMDAEYDREVQAEIERNAAALAERVRLAKEAEDKAEAERVEREKKLAEQAAERARLDAEEKARLEAEKAEQENQRVIKMAQDAREAKEQAERDKIAAQERAKLQAEQAERDKATAEAKAKQDALDAAENARLAEVKRQENEVARIENDKRIREEDLKHASKIMREAKDALMEHAGIDEETARRVVIAIKNEQIKNVSIQF